jgi:hypothetical protein
MPCTYDRTRVSLEHITYNPPRIQPTVFCAPTQHSPTLTSTHSPQTHPTPSPHPHPPHQPHTPTPHRYDNKILRFVATLDADKFPDDADRSFILSLRLSDNFVSVFEPPVNNSGIQGGTILAFQLVPRAGCNKDRPE